MSQEVYLELLPDHHFNNPGFTSSRLLSCNVQLVPGGADDPDVDLIGATLLPFQAGAVALPPAVPLR